MSNRPTLFWSYAKQAYEHGLSESRGYEEVDNEDVKTFITSRESTMEEIRGLCPVSLNVIEKKYHILAAGISYLS
ncbi:unnamed protein product [Rhizophagus irregularis]|nr:unnamed protein product [Rhizophagus irregularis]